MSGFQIPGLGFAKPNETLPPLPSGASAPAANVEGAENEDQNQDTQMGEDTNMSEDKPVEIQQRVETEQAPPAPIPQNEDTQMGEEKPVEAQPAPLAQPSEDTKMDEDKPAETTAEPQLPTLPPSNNDDTMTIDAAEPPSLTDALEAMINGLDQSAPAPDPAVTTTTAAPTAPAPAQETPQAPQPLEADQGDHPEWEIDSSPYESSSESSSSDSSDDDDSESGEGYQLLGIEETRRILMEMEGSDDEGGDASKNAAGGGGLRTKNELPVEVVPKPDITLTPEDKIEPLGAVDQIVDNIMVIKAFTPGEYMVLDSTSPLCTADRVVFGAVWETIGKVLQPMYTVMFTTAEELAESGLVLGTKVFYPTAHAKFVFTEPLKNLKGSDASNIHDEEVAEEEMEFSDDEKEAEHKRQAKQKKKDARFKNGGGGEQQKRPARGGREPSSLRHEVTAGPSADGGLNYDDEDDGPYKPLTRPPGFGQMPPAQQTFSQEPEPGRFGARRGGRGDFRGRGERGRGRGGRGRGGHGNREGYSQPPRGQAQQEQQHQGQWGGSNVPAPPAYGQQSAPAPAAPTFNFPFPGMPPAQQGQQGFPAVPPPPPGWPAPNGQTGQNPGAYINPAFFAALLGQMQQAQGGQQQQQQQQPNQQNQGQTQPPQQPPQWGAQPPPR
ncbi:H/ACA ribonucleoprotein complex non-core subunit NAF1 [Colletotrichum orbiculare MAFF 240422]|uniref:H/ACA ribonucleoprotein complex non-core subunit NAF1 n=1 Tax=Colletotrichum orbiculare (strain 104-T / ATCC 96160 / CBS 514.97 / LARS 414 / MAFF 240422) TaxID=1213857 RepID=N4W6M1_COLOR|nr:H/ACA ribonucleoprotein complex non-core subunit NAF1 [Colletotrichum orbiculare MAFF 240422]